MKWNIYKWLQEKIYFIRKIGALISDNELYMKDMDFKEIVETAMLEECNSMSGILPYPPCLVEYWWLMWLKMVVLSLLFLKHC